MTPPPWTMRVAPEPSRPGRRILAGMLPATYDYYPWISRLLDSHDHRTDLLDRLLGEASRVAQVGVTTPALDALDRALGHLHLVDQEVDPDLLAHLSRRLTDENKPKKLFEAATELGVAAWLSGKGLLSPPPGFNAGQGDPVIDLGARVPESPLGGGGVLGVEVKSNCNRTTDELLMGSHPSDDLGIRRLLSDRFGDDIAVAVEWVPFEPSPNRCQDLHKRVARRISKDLGPLAQRLKAGDGPFPFSVPLPATSDGVAESGRRNKTTPVALHVTIARHPLVSERGRGI